MFLESKQYTYLVKDNNTRVIIETPENALIYLLEFIDDYRYTKSRKKSKT